MPNAFIGDSCLGHVTWLQGEGSAMFTGVMLFSAEVYAPGPRHDDACKLSNWLVATSTYCVVDVVWGVDVYCISQ